MGLLRGKIRWNIPGAGTAWTVLHFGTLSTTEPTQADADAAVTRMQSWATSIKSLLPNVVSLNVQAETEQINIETGHLIGVFASTTPTTQTGTAAAGVGWAAAAGAVVSWSTPSVRNNRRVRGRTFVVPVSNEVWDVDGTLKSTPYGTLGTAATALRFDGSDIDLRIYCRPTTPGGTDGFDALVTGHRVPDMSAVLRSRRS